MVDMAEKEIFDLDVKFDNAEVVDPDFDPPAKMGNPYIEVTEEKKEAAQLLKSKAMDAVLEGKLNEAIDRLTEAIVLNPKSAILFASRATVFVKLKKPNAANRDADAALKIDPHLAKAYKALGMSRALLGLWEIAASDLHEASKLDFDEETSTLLKKVEANAKKIEEHWEKHEQLCKEREIRKAEIERQRLAQEAKVASDLKDGEVIVIKSVGELNAKLKAATELSRLAIIYFTAKWCGPCRYISPKYEALAAKYPKAVFLKVDIEEVEDSTDLLNVRSIPCFYLSQNGVIVGQGLNISLHSLEQQIAHHAR
ncbi:hypothetical protein ABFS82_09G006600 [Erythranthe guttata]